PYVGTQVVTPSQALFAVPARHAWLHGDALAGGQGGHAVADSCDDPARLVPEDQRLVDDVGADPAVLVVVDVGSADPYRPNLDEHLSRTRFWHRPLFDVDLPDAAKHAHPHVHSRLPRAHMSACTWRPHHVRVSM